MNKLQAYKVYIDDGYMGFRTFVPAESPAKAAAYVQGNGEVIAVRPADMKIDVQKLHADLSAAGWSDDTVDIICRTLLFTELGDC